MNRKSILLACVTVLAVATAPMSASAQFGSGIVFDPTQAANAATQITHMVSQLQQLKATYDNAVSQLNQAKQAYDSVTGSRGLGDILNNPMLRNYLPQDFKKIYDRASSGGYAGVSGTLQGILDAEKLTGSFADRRAAVASRRTSSAGTNKLVGEDGYAGAMARLQQLDQLQQQISQTQDPKALGELQARIQIEQANIAMESQKLQLLKAMADAEKELAAEQRRQLSRQQLRGTPGNIPHINVN